MDMSNLRFKVSLVKADGSEELLQEAATVEKYDMMESRLRRLQKRGVAKGMQLRYKAFRTT